MDNIRTALHEELKNRYERVYETKAPKKVYPYAVYEFYLTDDGTGRQLIFLELDGWDNKEDSTELENMMLAIDLDKVVIESDHATIIMSRESRRILDDEESKIKRRRYSFEGIVYERSI